MDHPSTLSDALLRNLMAVGQVDVLVGLPTLDNAGTVLEVVRAVHVCFTRDFPRLRTVMINSDGGSVDGTPELIRSASLAESDMVQTAHALRTLHRVVAPYHGLPGKLTALKTIFAASDLTQARVLVLLDPAGPATEPERVSELIRPVLQGHVDVLAPKYRRHPRDGVLITQLVRPMVRGLYGVELDEPLGVELACAGRFTSHCLEQEIWDREAGRFAIDLWLRTEAIAQRYRVGQIWRPSPGASGTRTKLREAVRQIVLSLVESLRAHEPFWTGTEGVVSLPILGNDGMSVPAEPSPWDYEALGRQARDTLKQISPLVGEVLTAPVLERLLDGTGCTPLDDDLWVRVVYAFATAIGHRRGNVDHLVDMFVPIYMCRASAFMAATAAEPAAAVQARLDSLCETFQRLKPVLVAGWSAEE